jgi:hypothetical protein
VDQDEKNFKILEITAGIRKFEIGLFWSRSLFFWGFSAVAIAAYGAAHQFAPKEIQIQFAVACAGLVCSVIWTLINRSSKYWQKVWEEKAASASRETIGHNLFEQPSSDAISCYDVIKKFPWWGAHFSVSKLATAFSDFTALVWVGLAFKATSYGVWLPPQHLILFSGVCTAIYLIYIFFKCRPDKPQNSTETLTGREGEGRIAMIFGNMIAPSPTLPRKRGREIVAPCTTSRSQ